MLVGEETGLRRRLGALLLGAVVTSCALCGLLPAGASAARHYEMVSPLDKGQGDIVGDGLTTVASRLGDAVTFSSRTPFGDTVGSGIAGQSQFLARRGDSGWVIHAITPMSRPDAVQTFFASTLVQIYSEDLRTAIVWAYDLPGVLGDSPLRNNIYAEDTATRLLEPITVSQVDAPRTSDFRGIRTWGISADARHVTFVTPTQFLPVAAPGVPNVYQWDDGLLSVAGILPDGSLPPDGSNLDPANYRSSMSADGTRLVFTASSQYGPSQLFMRVDGSTTVWISQPAHADEQQNSSNPSTAALQGVTPDGHTVFFTTDAGLVDSDVNGAVDLYRYTDSADPSSDRSDLTMISQDGDLDGGVVVGMSDDGQRVYYQTTTDHLSVWDHGATHLISDAVGIRGNVEDRLGVMDGEPGLARVTPDGRYLAFALDSPNDHDLLGNATNGHREMYLYDLDDSRLICVSCPSGPAMADVTIQPSVTSGSPQVVNVGFRPRFLTDRGQVFFSTADALLQQDSNGVADAYEYDPAAGRVGLLSTGRGSDPANFADASASGNDIFLLTRQRLVSGDRDDLVDVYDVRDGSSLPAPGAEKGPACEGEACQPLPSAPPPEDSLGSDQAGTRAPRSGDLVVQRRLTLRGAAGSLRVKLSNPGTLTWSGRGLRSGSIRRGKGGIYHVRLRLGRRARTQLRVSASYTTSVHLRFISAGGGDQTKRITRVTFRALARKGR
jgi:hypothetical protein